MLYKGAILLTFYRAIMIASEALAQLGLCLPLPGVELYGLSLNREKCRAVNENIGRFPLTGAKWEDNDFPMGMVTNEG